MINTDPTIMSYKSEEANSSIIVAPVAQKVFKIPKPNF